MKKMLLIALLVMLGCGDGKSPSGKPRYLIELHTGLTTRVWSVGSYGSGAGYVSFDDPETGRCIRIQGTVVITEQE